MIKASENLYNYLKTAEGFRDKPYKDAGGVKAIGYGSTDGAVPDSISEPEADKMMRDRVLQGEKELAERINRPLTQGQQDALVDMQYNLGTTKLSSYGFFDMVNSGRFDEVTQKIRQITKAKDKTGQLVDMPGLVKRSQQRALWWTGTPDAQVEDTLVGDSEKDLIAEMEEFDKNQVSLKTEDPEARAVTPEIFNPDIPLTPEQEDARLVREMEQFDAVGVLAPENVGDRIQQLRMAQGVATEDEAKRSEQTATLSKILGVNPLIIDADLEVMSPEQVYTKYGIERTARNFPELARWQKVPENYVVAERNPRYVQVASQSAKELSMAQRSDLSKTLQKGAIAYPKALIATELLTGIITAEDFQRKLDLMEDAEQELKLSAEGQRQMNAVSKLESGLIPGFTKTITGIRDTYVAATDEDINTRAMEELSKTYDGSVESFDKLMTYMSGLYDNPKGAALTLAQVLETSVPPSVAIVAGVATGNIPLAGAGLTVAGALSASESLMNDLEEFRDPNTGRVDVAKAFSDPQRASRIRLGALAYSSANAAGELVYSKVAGRFMERVIKSAGKEAAEKGIKATAKKVAKVGAGVVAEGGVGVIEEGATEFTSRTIKDVVQDVEQTPERIAENLAATTTEGILGGMSKGAIGTTTGAIRAGVGITKTGKQRYEGLKTKMKDVNSAINDLEMGAKLRQVFNSDDASKTFKDRMKDLVKNSSAKEASISDGVNIYTDEDAIVDSEVKANNERTIGETVRISPQEFKNILEENNVDVAKILTEMDSDLVEEYLDSLDTDTSIDIPVESWVSVLDIFPEIDEIARYNENDLNAREANATADRIVKDPFDLKEETEDGEGVYANPPEIPSEAMDQPPSIMGIPFAEDEIINLDDIQNIFRTPEEQKAYSTISSRLLRATKEVKNINKDMVKAFSDIQFQRVKNRASIMDIPVEDIAKAQVYTFGVEKGVGGYFSPVFNKIFFNKNAANAKTLVHEFGHSWLDEMTFDSTYLMNIPFEKMTAAQKDYAYSMDIVADMLEIGSVANLNDLTDIERTKAHEAFAQTTEKYFLEGDFQNSKIREVMENFRQYMTELIQQIQDYAVRMLRDKGYKTFDITPEVERMFEGIIGINNKIDEEMIPKFPDPILPLELAGNDMRKLYSDTRAALAESVAIFASKIMNKSYREREALVREAEDIARERASQIVESQSEFILAAQIEDQYNEFRQAQKEGKPAQEPRISFNSFEALFDGDTEAMEVARATIPNFVIAGKKKGGVDASMFMYSMGVSDVDAFISILMSMGTKNAQIDKVQNDILNENFPILKTDADIKDEAVKAIENTKTSRFLNLEMKIMAKQFLPTLKNLAQKFITSPETMASQEYITEQAERLVFKARAARFRASKFRKDYGRHSRKAGEYFRKGDFENAFNSKVQSMISYNAFLLANQAEKQMALSKMKIKQFEKYTRPGDYQKKYNPEMMLFGKAVIDYMGQATDERPVLSLEMFPYGSGINASDIHNVNNIVDQLYNLGDGVRGAFMTVQGAILFGNAVNAIKRAASRANKVELGNESMAYDMASEAISNEILDSGSSVSSFEKKGMLGKYKAAAVNVNTLLSGLFKNLEEYSASLLGQIVFAKDQAEARTERANTKDIQKVSEAFIKISKSFKGGNLEAFLGPVINFIPDALVEGNIWNYDGSFTPVVMKKTKMTFNNYAEFIMGMLLMGSESGAVKLLKGGANGSGDVSNMINGRLDRTAWNEDVQSLIDSGVLKKEHFDAMQSIWDMMREKHPKLKKVMRDVDKIIIGNIEGVDIETPWGTYKGAYMPVARDKALETKADFDALLDVDVAQVAVTDMYPTQFLGNTKSRTDTYSDNDLNPNRIISYLSSVNGIIEMRQELLTYGKVMTSPQVRDALEQRRPGGIDNVIKPSFERTILQRRSEEAHKQYNKFFANVRKNINRVLYLANFMTPLIQPLGAIPSLAVVKKRYMSKSIAKTSLSPMESFKTIRDSNVAMKDRWANTQKRMITDVEKLQTNSDWIRSADGAIDTATFIGIHTTQILTDMYVYNAAIEQSLASGKTDAQAKIFATNAVNATQSSSAVGWMNNFQGGPAIFKFIQGVATSYVFSMNNLMMAESQRSEGKTAWAKGMLGVGLYIMLLPTIMEVALREAVKGSDEEEDEDKPSTNDKLNDYRDKMLANMMGTAMPIVGQAAASYMFYGGGVAPSVDILNRAVTGTKRAAGSMNKAIPMTPSEMKAVLKTITLITGIPASVLAKDIFIEDIWIEGLNGESLDDRLDERRYLLEDIRYEKEMQQ